MFVVSRAGVAAVVVVVVANAHRLARVVSRVLDARGRASSTPRAVDD
tara:strand:+ start:10462 stop:10602 length:141 start_codon:yes stop_codon:yes gene_type:complete